MSWLCIHSPAELRSAQVELNACVYELYSNITTNVHTRNVCKCVIPGSNVALWLHLCNLKLRFFKLLNSSTRVCVCVQVFGLDSEGRPAVWEVVIRECVSLMQELVSRLRVRETGGHTTADAGTTSSPPPPTSPTSLSPAASLNGGHTFIIHICLHCTHHTCIPILSA